MNQQQISEINSHKHLGLIFFSNDCTWHEHLDYIKTKAWHRVNIMRKRKFTFDRKSLQTIYFTFIRPFLEYADIVWDRSKWIKTNPKRGSNQTSLDSLPSFGNWLGISDIQKRKTQANTILYKCKMVLHRIFLSSLVPPTVGSTTTYNLRNFSNLQTIHASSQLYYKSFLPSVTRSWNELSEDKRNSTSVAAFKSKLQSDVRSLPSFFLWWSKKDKYITRDWD